MITINLRPGTKRQAPRGEGFAGLRERFRTMGSGVQEPAMLAAGIVWLLVILVIGGMYLHANSRVHTLEPKLLDAQNEYRRYHGFVVEKRREEKARDSVLAQIGTISAVDQDRYIWPHILDEVAGAVPDFTWLTAITTVGTTAAADADTAAVPTVSVLIAGQTNDLQNYTAFLRRLGESHWLTNVMPVKTETIIDRSNRPITQFTVQVTFIRDSARMQRVPILESTAR